MALEATHVRLALDVQSYYQIQNLSEYLAGAVYPDSRYPLNTPREKTHNENMLKKEFATLCAIKQKKPCKIKGTAK